MAQMTQSLSETLANHIGTVARRFRRRLRNAHFWYIQALIAAITVFHFLTEASPYADNLAIFHHVSVTLYLIPIVYASLIYGWEGGLLTGLWVGVLSLPNIVMWHRHGAMWVGDVLKLVVVVMVGTIMSWRVATEARLRRKEEAIRRELAVSEVRYRNLFENAGDAIIVCDGNHRLVSANPAASALAGYSLAELPGMPITELLRSESMTASSVVQAVFCEGVSHNGPVGLLLRTKGGNEIHVEVLPAQLPDGEGGLLTETVIRDVTAQREKEMGLRFFIQKITQAQEEERKRIALELHDETVQTIAIIRRELQDVLSLPELGRDAISRIERVHAIAGDAAEEVRRFTRDLRPPMLDDLGLVPVLDMVTTEMSKRTGAEVVLEFHAAPRRLSGEVELGLFRIVQEALRNVEKHANASRVVVAIDFDGDVVHMSVQDNGNGFDLPTASDYGLSRGQLGLIGMRERASLLGAELGIQSIPGSGTTVTVEYQMVGKLRTTT